MDRLTFDPFNDTHPSWHPITGEIVYTSERGAKNRLVLINRNQGTERLLTDGAYNAISPSWTPDGKSILFCSDRQGIYDIHKLEMSHPSSVNSDQLKEGSVKSEDPSLTDNAHSEANVETDNDSSDSHSVVSAENDSVEPVGSRPTELELTRLTNMMTGCFNPSLAPDGKHLLFSAYQNGKYDVCIMEIAKTIEEKNWGFERGRTLCNFNGRRTRKL